MNATKTDVYISSSVNSLGKCLSWGPFLACGMNHSITLINQTSEIAKIVKQFTKHTDIVTSVSWIDDEILISGDNGGTIIIWQLSHNGELLGFNTHKVAQFLTGVTDVSGVSVGSDAYFICCCEDRWSLLKVNKTTLEVSFLMSLSYAPFFVHCVNVIKFENSLLISFGLSDSRVMCQFYDISENNLSSVATLVGHEDAIMALDSINIKGTVLLASASLDCYIRIWEINEASSERTKNQMDSHKIICNSGLRIDVGLGAVLVGHENWVTSANFCINEGNVVLVSTSMDKSVIVWRQTEGENEYSSWIEETRLGQVGGNGLGFIGGAILSSGDMIASVGYQGTMIVWKKNDKTALWNSVINVSGHFDFVEDLSWEKNQGRYLISVSKDQTSRIHAPWITNVDTEWHEIGRPQVHGYDLTCVTSLNPTRFVSGADEKISRVFQMNKTFHRFLVEILSLDLGICDLSDDIVETDALSLSNRVVTKEDSICDNFLVPKEDCIAGRTLWPEVTKLYGHVFELFRVSFHEKKKILATSCKAAIQKYADVIIWDTNTWNILQRLDFHKLTIVRIQFSKSGDKILTVSKDRQWALWKTSVNEGVHYELSAHSSKLNCHSKIIWDVDWTVDDAYFVTVSRDKKVMLWNGDDGSLVGSALVMKDSVNAISTWPIMIENCHIFAIGLENGDITVISFNMEAQNWSEMLTFSAHHNWITRLSFNPIIKDGKCLLASSSKDRFVKIFDILIK